MQNTPIKTISKTEASIDALQFAHRWLLKKAPITEEQWVILLYEQGYSFASKFASIFPDKKKEIEDLLTKSPAEPGSPNNWYWMWWKLKWMQDDWEFINYKVYDQPCSYLHFKSYMQNCERLEAELLNLIPNKNVF